MARPPSPGDARAFERARRLFQSLGDVRIRRMFGGAGVYVDGVMMALIADGEIYLKVDGTTVGLFRDAGCRPFQWVSPSRGVPVRMSYWTLPAAAADDPEQAAAWGSRALEAARRRPAKPASRRRRPAP